MWEELFARKKRRHRMFIMFLWCREYDRYKNV